MYAYTAAQNRTGLVTHFWTTAPNPGLDNTLFRYYIDGETTASIQFYPSMACGVGSNDVTAPWGTRWFGKGAADGAWFNNFRIPFQQRIRVTVQNTMGVQVDGFYLIVRGQLLKPSDSIVIGNIPIPSTARMNLQIFNQTVPPLAWVPIASVPSGSGLFFMHTISVAAADLNFLEGCYHQYAPFNQSFPGTLLSTGTEDYFDSAWYFNAGQFRMEVSGFTHMNSTSKVITWSAYRFHEMDPLPFDSGFQLVWRNGDMLDKSGLKCMVQENGAVVGTPSAAAVLVYAWVYTW